MMTTKPFPLRSFGMHMKSFIIGMTLLALLVLPVTVQAFFVLPSFPVVPTGVVASWSTATTRTTRLYAGDGVATNYTWHEEAFEIEVSVKVPKQTMAKDIQFKATSRSIDLKLLSHANTNQDDDDDDDDHGGQSAVVLLDGSRQMRGRINLDGTYWVISDAENDADKDARIVTVTIEKLLRTPKDDFEVIDYDWKGVYADEDTDEVSSRRYDEPETLNVREYAAQMGVDIDNINMSMVDKTMFSSGLNLTQSSMEEMQKAGLLQAEEVTQQKDGKEFTIQDDGEPQAFTPYGNAIHPDEMVSSSSSSSSPSIRKSIPLLDTDSPWHQAVPVENATQHYKSLQRNMTRAAFAADAATAAPATTADNKSSKENNNKNNAKDPIDTLTKKRLQEILKSQGLSVTGNKDELKQRLRSRVNSLMQGKQET
eukprot:scaffold16903_cov199-Amphora_coffeaeformis.AAC.2